MQFVVLGLASAAIDLDDGRELFERGLGSERVYLTVSQIRASAGYVVDARDACGLVGASPRPPRGLVLMTLPASLRPRLDLLRRHHVLLAICLAAYATLVWRFWFVHDDA